MDRLLNLMRNRPWTGSPGLIMIVFLVFPFTVNANGIIPELNAYRSTPVFYFSFWAVIIVESLWIRLWLRREHLWGVLWRVIVINAISSLAGYGLMISRFAPDFARLWQQAIPFFVLTLAVEWPLARLLFRKGMVTWKSAFYRMASANVLSYVMLIAIESPIDQLWFQYRSTQEYHNLARWENYPMLSEAPGRIYGTQLSAGGNHQLKYYSFADCRWHAMTNCPPIDPLHWDVTGSLFAYAEYPPPKNNAIKLARLPEFTPIREIAVDQYKISVKISPDQKKLAVAIWQYDVDFILSATSYRTLASVYQVMIYDVATGQRLIYCPRLAVESELCWLGDSKTLLYRSLRDLRMLDLPVIEKEHAERRIVDKAMPGFEDRSFYACDIETGRTEVWGNIHSPCLVQETGFLAWQSDSETISMGNASGTNAIKIGTLHPSYIEMSPDGRFAMVPYETPFNCMTIVDLRNPSRKHFFGWSYQFAWRSEK